jgi:hypothetical protein
MNPFVGVGLVLALAACGVAQAPVLSQVPQEDQIIQMSYVALSDCVYSYIDPLYDNAVKKIDLPSGKITTLVLESPALRHWEIIFTDLGNSRSKVISRLPTHYGDLIHEAKIRFVKVSKNAQRQVSISGLNQP